MNGINLGGWLVTEPWITPSFYNGAPDEYTLVSTSDGQQALRHHYDTFITAKDFAWIAERGFTIVRLPVGYWMFGDAEPYIDSVAYVDKAFKWAEKYGVKILLDLHTALGSQNGEAHSGKQGDTAWHTDATNIESTIATVAKIAHRYKGKSELWGIEVLNEPSKFIPLKLLKNYYRRAYDVIREECGDQVTVVISDAYRAMAVWDDLLHDPAISNMLLDIHMYQLYTPADQKLSLDGHVKKAVRWQRRIEKFGADKLIVGEWSGALHQAYDNLDDVSKREAQRLYIQSQRFAFANTQAHFYWTYKTEDKGVWSYRHLK